MEGNEDITTSAAEDTEQASDVAPEGAVEQPCEATADQAVAEEAVVAVDEPAVAEEAVEDVTDQAVGAAADLEDAEEAVEATAEQPVTEVPEQPVQPTDGQLGQSEPKESIVAKMKAKPLIPAIIAVVVVIIIGAVAFTSYQSSTYDQASKDYAAGNYAEAAAAFKGLGGYKDSSDMYAKAAGWVEATSLEEEASNTESAEAWQAAADAYAAIDEAEAQADATRCSGNADYYTAKAMLKKSPTDRATAEKALALFENCEEIADAQNQVAYCKSVLAYYEAGDLYAQGKYYEAYQKYGNVNKAASDALGDVGEKEGACIQANPGNGVVWRNASYSSDDVELTIKNSGHPNAYYKLYMGNDLVITVFISADGEATFRLPSGTYSMNKAYGDMWFGPDDMFGDGGSYYKCDFAGSSTFELESGNGYEISSGGEGTGIGSQSTNRNAI